MNTSLTARAGALAAVLAVVLAGCGGGDSGSPSTTSSSPTSQAPVTTSATPSTTPATTATTIEVQLAGGSVVGGPRLESVRLGADVILRATSDVAEEIHVHTYDLTADVGPGQPGEVRFKAAIPGRHEVEFEEAGKVAITLEVR